MTRTAILSLLILAGGCTVYDRPNRSQQAMDAYALQQEEANRQGAERIREAARSTCRGMGITDGMPGFEGCTFDRRIDMMNRMYPRDQLILVPIGR